MVIVVKHSSFAGQKLINKKMERKRKISFDSLQMLPPYTFIVTEGSKTEPNYLNGFAAQINAKYRNFSQGELIKVEGVGRNTKNLLEHARKLVEKEMPQAKNVWIVYDRDDFPSDNFDNAYYSIVSKKDKRKYFAIWSNECFELWFVLHFQEIDADTGRKHLKKLLKKHIGMYEKNMPNIYSLLSDKTKYAIKRAERLYKKYNKNLPPSKMCPCTMVFELVKELYKYI